MNCDDSVPAAVIDRDLTALAQRLPTVLADHETFRRCRAVGRRRRRRRVLAVTATPMVLTVAAVVWAAGHDGSVSTMVVTPATTSSAAPAPTPRPQPHLTKVSKLDARYLPPGAKLFLTGDLHGQVWRSYLLPDAPEHERLILSASAGDVKGSESLAVPGMDHIRITIGGEPAILNRRVGLARIDWVNVQQSVQYTVLDSDGILTNNTLIDVAEGLTAR